ncbi:MAG: glycosyltransferase family 1 protein [bacterium]
MTIGINAAAAIKQPRTGVEEYVYQLIKHLTMLPEAGEHRFLLYLPAVARRAEAGLPRFDFELPENFQVKKLKWPLPMWTQLRLASEMVFNKPDALFIPVHVLPLVHPKNSVVTIHGLEYEYFPEMYPWRHRQYLRWSTKYAVKHARKIIAVSQSTKNDLMKLYEADESKITVVHHGVSFCKSDKSQSPQPGSRVKPGMTDVDRPYLLYIGRIELKKNVLGILEAYNTLKEKYKIPHELVLVGSPGFGYDKIRSQVSSFKFQVHELGYVSEDEKQKLLSGADVFLFPSLYEGFGMPILEAQAAGIPVVTSNISSMPEVVNNSALLVSPKNSEEIAETIYKLIDDKQARDKLIELGYENLKRFSWKKCAKETLQFLTEK